MSDADILADPDREVWVVEQNPGSGWRVSAVLTSFADAEAYEDDLRKFNEDMETRFRSAGIKTRHGGRNSPTKMFETYPPE